MGWSSLQYSIWSAPHPKDSPFLLWSGIGVNIIHPTGSYCRSENISPSLTAALATSSRPGSIIQQRRHLPLEMI